MSAGILEFGEFELDCGRFELRRKGVPVRLERKPMELLILLASSDGRLVTRQEIAHCLWPSEVFVDTEHGINTAIRKIRHALREDSDRPRFLQTVTGKGYRFTEVTTAQSASAAPPWNQPVQPAEVQPLEQPAMAPLVLTSRGVWLTAGAAGLAVLILAVTFGARSVRGHTERPVITSIAVLPLDNLSGDPSQNYLADGMTDELTTMLAKDSSLRVISRTSVMQYKDAHRPLPEIARQLNVDGILEGSLARSGDKLHMTVQLIHGPSDTHVWAESYDRTTDDTVTLPQDAALAIARATHSSIPSATPVKYINPAAHDAYLRGNFHWFSGDQAGAAPYYLKATQIQPDYAAAWAGLADSYGAGAVDDALDPRQALPLAVSAAQKSLDLDPSLAQAHLSLAADKYWLTDWNIPAALTEIDRSIELDPKCSQAWHMRGKLLIEEGRYEEGIAQERKAMEIDPFQRPWGMVYAYLMSRNFDAAISEAEQRLATHPDAGIWFVVSYAYDAKHMDKEAEHGREEFLTITNQTAAAESQHRVFARGGRDAVIRWKIDALQAKARKQYVSPYLLASYYARLGDRQRALDYLDESLRQHGPQLLDLQNDAAFDSLHPDPHYRAIVQKVGLPPRW